MPVIKLGQSEFEHAIFNWNIMYSERTGQLEAANKVLEAFTYSVSHDLRAPLRAIGGYSNILLEDYSAKLDEEGNRVCTVIRNETQRMGLLIDDLLSISHIGVPKCRSLQLIWNYW